jgi:hypothetical protein
MNRHDPTEGESGLAPLRIEAPRRMGSAGAHARWRWRACLLGLTTLLALWLGGMMTPGRAVTGPAVVCPASVETSEVGCSCGSECHCCEAKPAPSDPSSRPVTPGLPTAPEGSSITGAPPTLITEMAWFGYRVALAGRDHVVAQVSTQSPWLKGCGRAGMRRHAALRVYLT